MTKRSSRLKPWPTWAGREYETALVAARRLRQESRESLWRLENETSAPLKRILPNLARHARDANLAGLTAQALKREHPDERWPRWAVQALRELVDDSGTAIHQTEAALNAANRRDWAEVQRLLTKCLAAAQRIELLLLTGPPPDGVAVSELEL